MLARVLRGTFFGSTQRAGRLMVRHPARSLLNFIDLRQGYRCLAEHKKMLSPFNGMIFFQASRIQWLYELIERLPEGQHYAMGRLVTTLFHRQRALFRATHNKSEPGYSLPVAEVAIWCELLATNVAMAADWREELKTRWRNQHLVETGSKLSQRKVDALLDDIAASVEECKAGIFPHGMTQMLLQGWMVQRAAGREQIVQYLEILPSSFRKQPVQKNDVRNDLKNDTVNPAWLEGILYGKTTDEAEIESALSAHYEEIIFSLIKNNRHLRCAQKNDYGYQSFPPRPSCTETVFHNLVNLLLYNSETGKFDFNLLPEGLRPDEKLVEFYAMQHFEASQVCAFATGQAFMNLVSGRSDLFQYSQEHGGDYELIPHSGQCLSLLNYLFGTAARNFAELGLCFSDERRQVIFSSPDCQQLHVDIIYPVHEEKNDRIEIGFSFNHAWIEAKQFGRQAGRAVSEQFLNVAAKRFATDPALFTLLASWETRTGEVVCEMEYTRPFAKGRQIYLQKNSATQPDRIVRQDLQQLFSFVWCYEIKSIHEAVRIARDILELRDSMPSFDKRLWGLLDGYLQGLARQFPGLIRCFAELNTPGHRTELIDCCLRAGIDADYLEGGRTPLLRVAAGCRKKGDAAATIALLLKAGADPNATCETQNIALHYAVLGGDIPSIQLLLEAGANPFHKNMIGLSPLDLARESGHERLFETACESSGRLPHHEKVTPGQDSESYDSPSRRSR